MKWLAQNQIMLKSNTLAPAIIIGLRSDILSHTKQYFYFLVARYFIWTCRTKEVNPKIEGFPGFPSSFGAYQKHSFHWKKEKPCMPENTFNENTFKC